MKLLLLLLLQVGLILASPISNKGCSFPTQGRPTVFPVEPFDAQRDATHLFKAIDGWGTDEDVILDILPRRSIDQRLEIAKQYKHMFGQDLIEDLCGDLSGDLQELVDALMYPLPQLYARNLYYAMDGVGTDDDTLAEILTTLDNCAMRLVTQAYEQQYIFSSGVPLEADLAKETSEGFKRFLISLSIGQRDESTVVDPAAAVADAQELSKAGKNHLLRSDVETYNSILVSRSWPQLRRIFEEYEKLTGVSLEEELELNVFVHHGFLPLVKYLNHPTRFFAERLHQAMAGLFTDDTTLMRIVVAHSETDLEDIKDVYQYLYGSSLREDIVDDTSGDYRILLLRLVS